MVRILTAENNKGDVRLLRMALEREDDWPVDLAVTEDGEKALDYLYRRPPDEAAASPDLVILDLNLPRRNGVEVLQGIRHNRALSKLLVIMLSSSPQDAIEDRVRNANVEADAYFTKPFDLDEYLGIGRAIRDRYYSLLVQRVSGETSHPASHAGRSALLNQVLREVSPCERAMLERFYICEHSSSRICQDMHVPEAEFRKIRARVRARFRELARHATPANETFVS